MTTLKRLGVLGGFYWTWLAGQRGRLALVAFLTLLVMAAEAALLWALLVTTDLLLGGPGGTGTLGAGERILSLAGDSWAARVRAAALFIILAQLFQSALQFVIMAVSQRMAWRLDHDLKLAVFDAVYETPTVELRRRPSGEYVARLQTYTTQATTILLAVMRAVPFLGMLSIAAVGLVGLSPPLALAAAVSMAGASLVMRRIHRLARSRGKRVNAATVRLSSSAINLVQHAELFRQMAVEPVARDRFGERCDEYRFVQTQRGIVQGLSMPLFTLLGMTAFAVVLAAAVTWPPGSVEEVPQSLVAFMAIMVRTVAPAANLNGMRTQVGALLPAVDDLVDNVRPRPPRQRREVAPLPLREAVRLEGVSLSYDGGTHALRDVTLDIPRGSFVALVGPSGSGKSTVINLVTGILSPTRGRVAVDGRDLAATDLRAWRRSIGIVSQDPAILDGTVRENIRLGRVDATDDEVEAAARAAQAHEFIAALPHGYDTPLGERGATLSGGERQRIAIARAVIRDPDLLLLDEATSSLDAVAERQVHEALERAAAGRTVVAAAHRLATVVRADRIIVMQDGAVVAQGTHEELLRGSPTYERMARLQGLF